MGTRTRLNAMHGYGTVFLAALVGSAAKSWAAFAVALALLLAVQVRAGNIRPSSRRRS